MSLPHCTLSSSNSHVLRCQIVLRGFWSKTYQVSVLDWDAEADQDLHLHDGPKAGAGVKTAFGEFYAEVRALELLTSPSYSRNYVLKESAGRS